MKEYTLKLNFIIPILRVAFLIISAGLVTIMALVIIDKGLMEIMEDVPFLLYTSFLMAVFTFSAYSMGKGIFKETLWVNITKEHIKILNLALLKTTLLPKGDIVGIYNSEKKVGKGSWKTIIIQTIAGERFELVQFNYFDFKNIIDVLNQFGYKRTGSVVQMHTLWGKKKEFIV